VEPSLTLIHKMCQTLGVTPNELLGFADFTSQRPFEATPGVAEAADGAFGHDPGAGNVPAGSLAWGLAAEAVAIINEHAGRSKAASDPLHALQETSALFRSLQADPYGTVAQVLNDQTLKAADPRRKARLAELVQAFTASLGETPAGRRRR
jgi:hypothetical protein